MSIKKQMFQEDFYLRQALRSFLKRNVLEYGRDERGGGSRECFLVWVHYRVLTLVCEDSTGLLTSEMRYLLSAAMMGR